MTLLDRSEPAESTLSYPRSSPREDIRPPKFADKFAWLDFEASPMPVIAMFAPPQEQPGASPQIQIRGEDLVPRTADASLLAKLPRHTVEAALVCQIFNWYEVVEWRGIRFSELAAAMDFDVHAEGYFVFQSADGHYFETLSRDEAMDPRVLLATEMNGQPLEHRYGGPMRLVVPFLQGYKSVKWVGAILAYRHDPVGIKRLLGQSKTGRLGAAWLKTLEITPAEGRAGDP